MMNKKTIALIAAGAGAGVFGVLVATNAFTLRRNIPREYYRLSYIADEKIRKSCDTLFIGDSITWLYDLKESYPGKDYVNRGISGDKTTDILRRCEHTFSNVKANKIVILAGINDLVAGVSSYQVLVNLFKIVGIAKKYNPEAEIFVESVYPVNNDKNYKRHDNCTERILEVNAELKEKAQALGYTYIDMFSALNDGKDGFIESYTYDGLHPSKEGYKAITEELEKYI